MRELRCLRPHLDLKTASTIATSIVHSKLDYCNSLYYNLPQSETDLEFSRLESWSRDVSRPVFTSLGLSLCLGTSEFWSWSWSSWISPVSVSVLVLRIGTVTRSNSCIHCYNVFCLPFTSAPVERIFSHSGLLMREKYG